MSPGTSSQTTWPVEGCVCAWAWEVAGSTECEWGHGASTRDFRGKLFLERGWTKALVHRKGPGQRGLTWLPGQTPSRTLTKTEPFRGTFRWSPE